MRITVSSSSRRAVACAAVLAALPACSKTTETVRSPAVSTRGQVGFGVMSTTQAELGASISGFRTSIAGASAEGVEPGGGDWVWRINKTGTTLEICHGVWATRPCRTALFDGGPNLMPPFLTFSTHPVLVDPVNLGRTGAIVTDADGRTTRVGHNIATRIEASVPVTPGYGVWALGGGGILHHCQLEGETAWCHAAKIRDGQPIGGTPLSVKTYHAGKESREGIWLTGGTGTVKLGMDLTTGPLFHCEAKSGVAEAPACQLAVLDSTNIRISGANPLSLVLGSHLVRTGDVDRHVLWLQIDQDALVRCEAAAGAAPTCVRAKKG